MPARFDGVEIGESGRIGPARRRGQPWFGLLAPQPQQPIELRQRVGMVIDTQVEVRKILLRKYPWWRPWLVRGPPAGPFSPIAVRPPAGRWLNSVLKKVLALDPQPGPIIACLDPPTQKCMHLE